MTPRRLIAVLAMLLLFISISSTTNPLAASSTRTAQQNPDNPRSGGDPLRIESVSPWVAADGEFQVRFAPSPTLPSDTRLTVTVHESLRPSGSDTLRTRLLSIIEGGPPGRILQAPITTPVSELGDVASGLVVSLPVRANRAESDRVLLPNPGIHPIELVLTEADGPELWREVVFLNRLPVDVETDDATGSARGRVQVSLVLPIDSPPAVGPAGEATFSLEDQNALSAAGSLLQRIPDAPLLVAARPNTLDGLARAEQRWAETLLEALSAPGSAQVLSLVPYVEVDIDALLDADAGAVFGRQLLVGAGAIIARTTQTPVVQVWASDDPIDGTALSAIGESGFGSVFVPTAAVDPDNDLTDEELMTKPFRLEGRSELTGLAYDEQISTLLAEGGASPGSRAHGATALLMASWFTSLGDDDVHAAAVLLSPTIDPTVIELLSAALGGSGPLETDPGAPLPEPTDATVALAPRNAAGMARTLEAFTTTTRDMDSYRSMTGDADPALAVWNILNDQTVAFGLDPAVRDELHAAIDGGIADRLAMIELPRSRRVVLTSDDSSIPLRFRNDLDFDVTLRLQARSARLDLDDDRLAEIVLAPGENRVDIPVTVQAPGETLLRLRVSAPDDGLEVGAVEVPVRSTGISGVGAALSAISIAFLVLWWIHTHRRTKRARTLSSGTHPSVEARPDHVDGDGDASAPERSDAARALTADRLDRGG